MAVLELPQQCSNDVPQLYFLGEVKFFWTNKHQKKKKRKHQNLHQQDFIKNFIQAMSNQEFKDKRANRVNQDLDLLCLQIQTTCTFVFGTLIEIIPKSHIPGTLYSWSFSLNMIHHVFVLWELTLLYLLLLKWMVCIAYVKYGGFVPGISFPSVWMYI